MRFYLLHLLLSGFRILKPRYTFVTLLVYSAATAAIELNHGGQFHSGSKAGEWHTFSDTAMTTRIELELWHEDPAVAEEIAESVFAQFHLVEKRMSRYLDDSELSIVISKAGDGPVPVSSELYDVIRQSLEVSRMSLGAFDISYASAGYLYNYRESWQPESDQLADRVQYIDYQKIALNASKQTIELRDQNMIIDLGGIAKGYAVDCGVEVLQRAGIKNARLGAGGDMRLLGDKRGKPWIVGIRDPRREEAKAVLLPLSDVAVSTSGDYERYFIDEDGERVHHILSPKDGKPVKGIQSVTILGDKALETDGLSTAVFVLGVQEGLELVNSLPNIDAIIVDENRRLHYSDDLQPPQ